jgi:hypothetical protein
MSFTIDIYQREFRPYRNMIHYLSFVSFFPHLVAGPIMRVISCHSWRAGDRWNRCHDLRCGIRRCRTMGGQRHQGFRQCRLSGFHQRLALYESAIARLRAPGDRPRILFSLLRRLDRPLLNNPNYLDFLKTFRQTGGWVPENDIQGGVYRVECDVATPTFFSLQAMSQKPYIEGVFNAYAELACRHHVTSVIAFSLWTAFTGAETEATRAATPSHDFDAPTRKSRCPSR